MKPDYRPEYREALERFVQAKSRLDDLIRPISNLLELLQEYPAKAAIVGVEVQFGFPGGHNPSQRYDGSEWPEIQDVALALKDWQDARLQCQSRLANVDPKLQKELEIPPEIED